MTNNKGYSINIFISRLEQLIEHRGITAYRLAKELDTSEATVSNWRNGKTFPSSMRMKQLADYFDVSTDFLVGNIGGNYLIKNNSPTYNTENYQTVCVWEVTAKIIHNQVDYENRKTYDYTFHVLAKSAGRAETMAEKYLKNGQSNLKIHTINLVRHTGCIHMIVDINDIDKKYIDNEL